MATPPLMVGTEGFLDLPSDFGELGALPTELLSPNESATESLFSLTGTYRDCGGSWLMPEAT